MQLSTHLQIVLASFLFASACAVNADDGGTPGGLLAVVTPDTLLKPLLNSSDGLKSEERRESVLRGLLQVRQYTCPVGWGGCTTGSGCCPIGGQCCSNNKCCDAGHHCCQGGGCCSIGDNCVQVVATGERGCCPIGRTCVGNGGSSCATASYSPCPNDNFCCPPGDICYRDSSNARRCRTPGSTPPPTSSFLNTLTRSSGTPTPTGLPTITPSLPALGSGGGIAMPTVYPSPFPSSGSRNVVVYASDTRIIWSGAAWVTGPSSCNSTTQSKKATTAGHSFTFTVTRAESVWISLSTRNVDYDITYNGRTTKFLAVSTLNDCKLTWTSGAITTSTTTITVTVNGPPARSGRRQLDSDTSFEFHNFLTNMPDSATATDSANTGGSTDAGGFPGSGSGAMTVKAQSAYFTGIVTAFMALLGFF